MFLLFSTFFSNLMLRTLNCRIYPKKKSVLYVSPFFQTLISVHQLTTICISIDFQTFSPEVPSEQRLGTVRPTVVHYSYWWWKPLYHFHLLFDKSIIVYRHTGCGTCQDSRYNIVKYKYYTLHITKDTYYVSRYDIDTFYVSRCNIVKHKYYTI